MRKHFALLLSLVLAGLWVHGGPKEDLKNAGTSKDYPGAKYLVVFDRTEVDVQESGLSYNNIHTLYKVLTKEGAKALNHLTFNYDPLSAFVEIKELVIHRKNGDTEVLGLENNIYDYPAPARMIYWGARQKMADIGRLEPGDGIEVKWFRKGFTYALLYQEEPDDSRYIPPMRGHYYDIVEFWNSQPVKEKVYEVAIPKDKDVSYKFFHGEAQVSKTLKEGKVHYTFTKKNMMPISYEPNMVAYSDIAPKLLITTSPDWEAKSRWFYGVNEDFGSFESTPEIDAKVAEILEGATSEMDSISRLNHWVADNIRYSGLSMGEGEGYTLHKGEMTFTDRCGVCKDKAGMLITMLRSAGFESYAAMTMAGSRIEDIPADQFNHSITVVKLRNGEYKLLDPTWVPFVREEWSSREQQQNYLMGLPEGADLMITDISAPENHYLKITGEGKINEDGSYSGKIIVDAEGQSDAALRGMFTRDFKANWDKNLERELLRVAPDAVIKEMSYSDPYGHMEGPIHIELSFEIPRFAIATDNKLVFTPVIASNIFARAQGHLRAATQMEDRDYPFRDGCSRLVQLEESIELPGEYTAAYLPETEAADGSAASFEGGYTIDGNKLILKEEISIKKRLFEANEWDNYRSAVNQQKKLANEKVILSRAE